MYNVQQHKDSVFFYISLMASFLWLKASITDIYTTDVSMKYFSP